MFRNSKKLGRGVSFLTSSLLAVSSLLLPTAASASPYTLTCSQSVSDPDTPFSLGVGDEVTQASAQDCAGALTIPEGVKKIGFGAFVPWDSSNRPLSNDKITSISIPSSLTEIFVGGFINLSSVQSLVIPSNVTTIGHQAFQGMTSLETITIQGSSTSTPTTIDYYALNFATVDLTLGSGKIELKDIFGAGATFESVDLGTGLISIGKSAFRGQTFSELRIPHSVETIDQQAFAEMPNLREIEFGPNTPGITSIDASAFSGTNITSVQYCGGNSALDSYLAANLPAADVYCDATVLPSVPSVVSATSGVNEVVLTVVLGAENEGSAPSNFAVEFSSDSTNWVSYVRSPASSSTSIAVPNLVNEVSYQFRVAAINQAGMSAYSETSFTATPRALRYGVTYLAGAGTGTAPVESSVFLPGDAVTLLSASSLSKENFTFSGWSDGTDIYQAGESYRIGQSSVTFTAQWIQDSLFGIDPNDLTLIGSLTAGAIDTSITGTSGGSTVTVGYVAGGLPTGTVIDVHLLASTTRARSLITTDDTFILSFVVAWLAPDGTVPLAAEGKAITMTIVNPLIKEGSSVYSVLGNSASLIATASVDGEVTLSITEDPEIVITAPLTASTTTAAPSVAYPGPLVVGFSQRESSGGETVRLTGTNLDLVTSLSIDDVPVLISEQSALGLDLIVPEGLQPGVKNLVVVSSLGTITIQAALTIVAGEQAGQAISGKAKGWTKKVGDSAINIYAKDVVGAGKVQFFVNGKEAAWIRAEDDRDQKLRIANGAHYLVRTVKLVEGVKNVFEIHVDGMRIWRTAYTG